MVKLANDVVKVLDVISTITSDVTNDQLQIQKAAFKTGEWDLDGMIENDIRTEFLRGLTDYIGEFTMMFGPEE